MGKGHAIRQALNYANGNVILIQDADLEYDPEDYEKLLSPITRNFKRCIRLKSIEL